MTQSPVEYRPTDLREIDLIRPLWEKLNAHHRNNARAFRDLYRTWTFEDRKAYFEKVAGAGDLRLDLAVDPASGQCLGYCVSSFSQDGTGEIESVFVEEPYRSQGIGTNLITRALAWLDLHHPERVRVSVADGNEEAFPFYRKFGFYPRLTVLERKRD